MRIPKVVMAWGLLVALCGYSASTRAQEDVWIGNSVKSNNWANPGNWQDGTTPLSTQSWRMRFDELTGPFNTANYTYIQTDPDHSFPIVTIVGGSPSSMTFLKTGDNTINITTKLTLNGTVDFPAILDIQANGFSVGNGLPTEVLSYSKVNVLTGKTAGLSEITIKSSAATPAELMKLGGGTITSNVLTIDAPGGNPFGNHAFLRLVEGSINANQLVLRGPANYQGDSANLILSQNMTVSGSTAAQKSTCAIGVGNNTVFTANATSVTVAGGAEPNTTLLIAAWDPFNPGDSGEFNATTFNITGSVGGSADVHLTTGMLRTSGLVKLSNPNAAPLVQLFLFTATITDFNGLEFGVGTTLLTLWDTTVRGVLKVTGATTVDVGTQYAPFATLEAGSLTIQGGATSATIWQPTITNGAIVTR